MKKLFLALVCFAGVAFFASCGGKGSAADKEPTVTIKADKVTVTSGEEFTITVNAESNTKNDLDTLYFVVSDAVNGQPIYEDTHVLSGSSVQKDIKYSIEVEESTTVEVTVKVRDKGGFIGASNSVKIIVNPAEVELVETNFEWYRLNNIQTGLDVFGLIYTGNFAKALYATIKPLENAKLYRFESSVYEATKTESAKKALFEDQSKEIPEWKEFDAFGNTPNTLDVVLGTVYQGKYHLIHVTEAHSKSVSQGTECTITGKAK